MNDKEKDLRDRAKKLSESLDLIYENGMFTGDYEDVIKDAKKHFSYKIKNSLNEIENSSATNTKILADLIASVSRLIIETARYSQDEDFLLDAVKFDYMSSSLFKELLGSKLNAHNEGEEVGAFVLGLKLYGSSQAQAYKSLGKWIGRSAKSVEAHYLKFLEREHLKNESVKPEYFVAGFQVELARLLLKFKDSDFPSNKGRAPSMKTLSAFDALKSALIDSFKDQDGDDFYIRHKPLISFPNWEDLYKLKKEIISLK